MYFWIRVISRPAAHFIGGLVSRQTNLAFCLVCLALLSTFTRYPRYLVVIVGIPVHTRIYVSGSSSNVRYDHDTIMISLARTFVLHSSMHGGADFKSRRPSSHTQNSFWKPSPRGAHYRAVSLSCSSCHHPIMRIPLRLCANAQ